MEQMKRAITGAGWDTSARAEEEVLKMTSLDLGASGPDNNYGWGLPQLLNVYALLGSQDEANIVATFGITRPLLRLGDSTDLSFSVRNLGGAPATGAFQAKIVRPDGTEQVLKSSTVTLSLLDSEAVSHTFSVSGNVQPGAYTFHGRFDYSWTHPDTGEVTTGSVVRSGTFEVKRVFVDFALSGLPRNTGLLQPQTVTLTATNTGNEPAKGVVVEFTVPTTAYEFVPGANFGRVTLIFDVGDLAEGAAFSFDTTLLPKEMGTHTFIASAKFKDGAGRSFTQGVPYRQTVGLPGP